jgi:hypothetical protein
MYKVVQIWPGQTVTCLHTNSPGHIWTTLYIYICLYPLSQQPNMGQGRRIPEVSRPRTVTQNNTVSRTALDGGSDLLKDLSCPSTSLSLKMEPIGSPKRSVSNQPTSHNNPENWRIQFNHGGSVRYRITNLNSFIKCDKLWPSNSFPVLLEKSESVFESPCIFRAAICSCQLSLVATQRCFLCSRFVPTARAFSVRILDHRERITCVIR